MFLVYQQSIIEDVANETVESELQKIEEARVLSFSGVVDKRNIYFYDVVAVVLTNSLDDAYRLMNLWDEPGKVIHLGKVRSLSVGDILVDPRGDGWIVKQMGFEKLPSDIKSCLPFM